MRPRGQNPEDSYTFGTARNHSRGENIIDGSEGVPLPVHQPIGAAHSRIAVMESETLANKTNLSNSKFLDKFERT